MRKMPEKPETQKEQLSTLWDVVNNCVLTKLSYMDWQIKFLIALVLVLLGVVLASAFGA